MSFGAAAWEWKVAGPVQAAECWRLPGMLPTQGRRTLGPYPGRKTREGLPPAPGAGAGLAAASHSHPDNHLLYFRPGLPGLQVRGRALGGEDSHASLAPGSLRGEEKNLRPQFSHWLSPWGSQFIPFSLSQSICKMEASKRGFRDESAKGPASSSLSLNGG